MRSSHSSHVVRIGLCLLLAAVLGYAAMRIITPGSFGEHGHFRGDNIGEQADVPNRHMTNASCRRCHEHEADQHASGLHKTISCEFCHGAFADHIKVDNNQDLIVTAMEEKTGEDQRILCLRCHNRSIQARPKEVIKTVVMPDHLRDQEVSETLECSQCHYVHAPRKYIDRANQMLGIKEPG